MPDVNERKPHGRAIVCPDCDGHGLVLGREGEPEECRTCEGSGVNWRYPGSAIARYPGGPFTGRRSDIDRT